MPKFSAKSLTVAILLAGLASRPMTIRQLAEVLYSGRFALRTAKYLVESQFPIYLTVYFVYTYYNTLLLTEFLQIYMQCLIVGIVSGLYGQLSHLLRRKKSGLGLLLNIGLDILSQINKCL